MAATPPRGSHAFGMSQENSCPPPPPNFPSPYAYDGGWKDDEDFQDDLRTYVKQNLRRQEILYFIQEMLPELSMEFAYSLSPIQLF